MLDLGLFKLTKIVTTGQAKKLINLYMHLGKNRIL